MGVAVIDVHEFSRVGPGGSERETLETGMQSLYRCILVVEGLWLGLVLNFAAFAGSDR